jgi:hypothetical protein
LLLCVSYFSRCIERLVRIARAVASRHPQPPRQGRGIAAEYVHVAIDDHSRIAFSAIYPDESRTSVLHFVDAAQTYYGRLGIRFKAVPTDNGAATAPPDAYEYRVVRVSPIAVG